ncbi:DNA double-strand break repair nuclease NurA [Sulfolobus sp. S-194]|uniref:DNA double-strand break repair nuclease NurA n=1 Tax=Sulfolobus sp. S-194 TaxID=2512240 RepID=UPI0014370463|nr:DNA double-strand break repair nuclease NurA [Sulfolobus sp. S-194]QIW23631.1 DNA double-strand break repair nuclease NurA [Sulfolobus sp. S-194]
MSDVIDKIKKLAIDEREKANKLKADILLLSEEIRRGKINLTFKEVKGTVGEHIACAIDGGKFEVDLGDSYLIIAKAVSVIGKYGETKEIPPTIVRDFKIVSDYYGEDEVKKRSIILMLTLETNLLSKANCDKIFIDGPLIDPPVYDEELEEYFLVRSSVIKRKEPIGIVKRFSHRLLINYLNDMGYNFSNVRESYLVTILFSELRRNLKSKEAVALGWIDWDEIFKKKSNIFKDLEGLSKAYLKLGLKIYSSYFQLSPISPVVRIDTLLPSGLDFIKIWGIEGEKEVTILNKIADNLAKVKSEEANSYVSLFRMLRGNEDFFSYLSKF